MRFPRRTARGCIPRCVYQRQRQRLRGLERPCVSRWLETGYAGPPTGTAGVRPELRVARSSIRSTRSSPVHCHGSFARSWSWPRSTRPPASRASSRTPTSRTRPLAAPNPAPTAAQSRSAHSATHHQSQRRDDHRRDRHLLVGRLHLHQHHRDRHHQRHDGDRHPHLHAQVV